MKRLVINISNCNQCIYSNCKKSSGHCKIIPCCALANNKALPYIKYIRQSQDEITRAIPTYAIPKWCPLDDLK